MGFWSRVRGFFPTGGDPAATAIAIGAETVTQQMERLEEQMASVVSITHTMEGCGCSACGGSSGSMATYGLRTVDDVRLAFTLCSPLPAIVNQKATYFSRGTPRIWNPNTEKIKRSGPWVDLLRKPNPLQGQRQFFRVAYSYMQKYGWALIEPEYASGFTDIPTALYVIPNWRISFDTDSGRITRAWYNAEGTRREIKLRQAFFILDTASNELDENTGLPLARCYPLEAEVSNSIGGLSARGANIEERGGVGLISNGSRDSISVIPMQPVERDRLERHFNRGGIGKGQRRILVSDSNLEFQPMLFDTEKLQLMPEHMTTLQAMCNIYCYPFPMLAEGYQAKYANSQNGRRDFQDATIEPESDDFFEQFSIGLRLYDQNLEMYMDYSGVASVQASQEEKGKGQKAMADAYKVQWELGMITRNDIREGMGLDRLQGEEFDKYIFELPEAQMALESQQASLDGQIAATEAMQNGTSSNDNSDEET